MSEACAHCGAALKSGLLNSNSKLSDADIGLINLAHSLHLDAACNRCSEQLLYSAPYKLTKAIRQKRDTATARLDSIILASIQVPLGWNFETISLVTAQTVTGTGVFSDVTSAFTDLFGTQSGAYNQKLRSGEDLCRSSLRAQAFQLGANAVVGVDVDYAEVGGARAMLMVCMTGTAIRVINPQEVSAGFANGYEDLIRATSELTALVGKAKECGITG